MSLPTELIILITNYLSVNDKRTGLMVCRDWYEAFRYGLYHEIHIKNIKQLLLLLQSLDISKQQPIPHGHLIKRLYINRQPDQRMAKSPEGVVLYQDLFQKLPSLCPYLEILDFDPESWNYSSYTPQVKENWSHSMRQLPTLSQLGPVLPFLSNIGKSLTHMSVDTGMMFDVATENRFDTLLGSVPNLKYLEFCSLDCDATTTNTHPLIITLSDMETIHRLVPHLQSLKIKGGNDIQMPSIDMDSDSAVLDTLPKFKSIETLHLNIPMLDATWLLYVIQKYPYVKDLEINLNYPTDGIENAQHDYSLIYTSLLLKCKYIQHLKLGSPDISHWLNPAVLKTVVERSCIRELEPFGRDNPIKNDDELRTAVQYGNQVLTGLYIDQWRLDTKITETVRFMYAFTKLSHLELRCDSYNDEYRLVDMLDACRNLKHLELEWGTILIPPAEYIYKRNYPLESLTMTYIAFEDTFFSQFLSTHCPHLTQISLSKCKQLCIMNNIKTQTLIEIDMPNHCLELVSIHNVRLEYSSASLFYHNTAGYLRILELKEGKGDATWYHHTGYKENNRRYPTMNTLDRIDQMSIHRYLNCPSLTQLSQQKWSDALKTDLMFGYISLNCKSIRNLFLDGSVHCT